MDVQGHHLKHHFERVRGICPHAPAGGGVARAPADKLEVVFANLCDGMSAEEIKRLTGAAAGGKKDMSFPQFMTLFDTAAVEDDRGT